VKAGSIFISFPPRTVDLPPLRSSPKGSFFSHHISHPSENAAPWPQSRVTHASYSSSSTASTCFCVGLLRLSAKASQKASHHHHPSLLRRFSTSKSKITMRSPTSKPSHTTSTHTYDAHQIDLVHIRRAHIWKVVRAISLSSTPTSFLSHPRLASSLLKWRKEKMTSTR